MLASLVNRVTAVFRRKSCPECGHKARKQTFCDVCGYDRG
jgi:ribosomal protein L32